MRWIAACCAVGFLACGVALLSLQGQIHGLQGQLTGQQHASQQVQRSDQQARAALSQQLATERAAFSQAEARIGGTHRDLITCADWQGLFLPVSGVDSFNGQLSASAGPPSLPQHCVNQ